jgi:hypothetical protein
VAADSRDEALAFLACLFNDEEIRQYNDLAAVFTSPATLRLILGSSVPFIPIVHSEDTERELADAYQRLHCIVFRPRNAVDAEADIALDLLNYDAFRKALLAMKIDEGDVDRLSRESGRSPTILRRRLSKNDAIKMPPWAGDDAIARSLVPIALIGTWHAESKADREIVSHVADRQYNAIESDVASMLRFDDCPVWSAGRYRGVASKIDALFGIARMMTPADLDRFFQAAETVLSESDPALELPEGKRWAAALYNKTRDHSNALREGICETLVLLSVHGDDLLQRRLGVDVNGRVANLVRKLLTPLSLEKLLSQDHNLPLYAEAAPEVFLKTIEEDLRCSEPVVLGLLKPVDSSSFWASPTRTGLLWALECLAWKPQNLPRVSAVLSRLSQHRIEDNWANKPEASLRAIFRSWMPQTAASLEERIKALERLANQFPNVGWKVCVQQLKPGDRIGSYSYKPRWRSDASGAGQVVSPKERYEFGRKALDLLLDWPSHDEMTLGDLVECLQGLPEEDELKVWNLIDRWHRSADEAAKAVLRERIRRYAFTRPGLRRDLEEPTRDRARHAYEALRSQDPVIRHSWLFADHWVQESAEEIEDENFDHRRRDEQIDRLRREAIAEIWTERGFDGVRKLIAESSAPGTVGQYVTSCVAGTKPQVEFIKLSLSIEGELRSKADWCLQGFVGAIEDDSRNLVLKAAAGGLSARQRTRLLILAPFQASTWRLVEDYGENLRVAYWKSASPSWRRHTPAERSELIDCLLEVERPRAAFHAVHMELEEIETSRLKRLLYDVATVAAEPEGHFRLEAYYLSRALASLDGRTGVSRDEMAQLEFLFLEALERSQHGIPNLERQIVQSPAVFVEALALAYKRRDDGEDPPEWRIENPDRRAAVALAAHRLLDRITMIPGTNDDGTIDATELSKWLAKVRQLCRETGRAEVGDHCLGRLLARAPEGENGVWPCEAVCEAMETIGAAAISDGFQVGVHNSRGVSRRSMTEGGKQERELASRYRAWAERLHFDYPYVGAILEEVAASYDLEAAWQDSEATVTMRLHQ